MKLFSGMKPGNWQENWVWTFCKVCPSRMTGTQREIRMQQRRFRNILRRTNVSTCLKASRVSPASYQVQIRAPLLRLIPLPLFLVGAVSRLERDRGEWRVRRERTERRERKTKRLVMSSGWTRPVCVSEAALSSATVGRQNRRQQHAGKETEFNNRTEKLMLTFLLITQQVTRLHQNLLQERNTGDISSFQEPIHELESLLVDVATLQNRGNNTTTANKAAEF